MFTHFQYAPLGLLQLLAAFAAVTAALLTLQRRFQAPGVFWLTLTLAASAWWSAMGGLELSLVALPAKILASQLSYLGILLSPLFLWRFAHDYTNDGQRPHLSLVLLTWLHVVATLVIAFTNEHHHLLWSEVKEVEALGLVNARYERGPWFWVNVFYCYSLALAASILLLSHALASQRRARVQNWIIIGAVFSPWCFSLAYMLRVPFLGEVDNTPVGFAAAGTLLSWNMLRFGLLKTFPLIGSTLLERMPDPVLVIDLADQLVLANPAAVSRFGLRLDEYSSQPLATVLADRPALLTALRTARTEALVPFRDGDSWWELLSSSLQDRRDRPLGRLHVLRDTTALRQALAQADDSARQAQRASAAKSLFIAQVSHDLRTPMHAILGTLDLLEEGRGAAAATPEFGTIREAGQALLTLINGLLDVSRIESGRVDLVLRPFRLASVLPPVCELLGVIARPKGLALHHRIAPEAAGALRGDPDRLRQILLNLVGNAVKFTARGSVTVVARAVPGRAEALCIEVTDTGPGIPAEAQPHLFNAFDRGDPEIARRHEGSGLGLAIVKRLVEAMRGEIAVHSTLGQGSRFVVTLPLLDPTAESDLQAAEASARVPAAPTAVAPLAARRVLLADDDPLSRRVNLAMLQRCGCTVEAVEDGQAALDRLAERRYDLVVLDGMMPGLDGWETCRRIRARPVAPGAAPLPVIAISGDLMPDALARWREAGATLVLPKPLPPRELRQALAGLRG